MAGRAGVTGDLARSVGAELSQPVALPVRQLAVALARREDGNAAAVLFYGSALRDGAFDGVLDFYVLVDRHRERPLANRLLPPHVGYVEIDGLRAKVARITLAQFRAAMTPDAIDGTLWARFSQPCACVWARAAADRQAVLDAVVAAVVTAARWAAALGPERGSPADYWQALYRHTYGAELRIERGDTRAASVITADMSRYAQLLPLAWQAGGVEHRSDGGMLAPRIDRAAARRRWRLRRRLNRALNLLRLLKAAGTFDNAIDYVAWKVERHSGYRFEPSNFQRRHPLLAAPALYWRLKRRGVLR